MEYPSDEDNYSQEEYYEEESTSEETREEENITENATVIKKGNEVEEPEKHPSKEASPPLEQHEDEYFVHLSYAESDDELDNHQKSEQFKNTEKVLKELAEKRNTITTSTPERERDKKPAHIFPHVIVQTDGLHDTQETIENAMSDTSASEDEIEKNPPKRVPPCSSWHLLNYRQIRKTQ
ncbi:hypothetical protein JTB14_035272 [Gonioctena quinquepunctata]|nr:hypothetical protein JTB14_035272 [Gonioctena quinquepunctata]